MREFINTLSLPATLADTAKDGDERENVTITLRINEYETLEEFAQEVGGEAKAVTVINRFRVRNATQAAKIKYNNSAPKIAAGDEKAYQELLDVLPTIAANYRFEVSDGVSAKEVKDQLLSARDRLAKMSAEDRENWKAEDLLKEFGLI